MIAGGIMLANPDICPPDPEEIAEEYVLGKLTAEDATEFEDHFIGCPSCAKAVEDADVFVRAVRAAAARVVAPTAETGGGK